MTDKQLTEWLKSMPREIPAERVAQVEDQRTKEQGAYVAHHHHAYRYESRH